MSLCSNSTDSENVTAAIIDFDAEFYFVLGGVLHVLLVLIPVIIFGSISLSAFISKKLRDPVSLVFICMIIFCIVGPFSYGLLGDIGIVTNTETFGPCTSLTPRIFWMLMISCRWQLLCGATLLSVVQYVTVRWGPKKIPRYSVVLSFVVLLIIALLCYLPSFAGPQEFTTIRASLCSDIDSPITLYYPAIAGLVLFTLPQVVVVIVFSVLTIRYVRKNTVTVPNRNIVQNVVIIVASWTIIVVISRVMPYIVLGPLIFKSLGRELFDNSDLRILWVLYMLDILYPIFLILPLFLHKSVRQTVFRKFKLGQCCKSKLSTTK